MNLGFKELSLADVKNYFDAGEIGKCLKVYDDGSDAKIDPDTSWEDLARFADKGGRFATERPKKEINFPNGEKAVAPEYIDITVKGSLDSEREMLRETIRAYLDKFGIKTSDVDKDLLIHTESALVDMLEASGASFARGGDNDTVGEINVVVTTDMEVENVVAVNSNDLGKFFLAVDQAKADYYGGDMEPDADFTTVLGEHLKRDGIKYRFATYTVY